MIRNKKEDCLFFFFLLVEGWIQEESSHIRRGLCGLKLLLIPNVGACRLSYEIAQVWVTKGRGRHEMLKMLANKKSEVRLYYDQALIFYLNQYYFFSP